VGFTVARVTQARSELSALRNDCPRWHVWSSDAGHLYATGRGLSVMNPGGSRTVDATTEDGLRLAMTEAEDEHAKMTAAQRQPL
jgi:hypothetical protein